MSNIFSKNLVRIRKERSLSQEQLANLVGLSKRQIGYYESGLNDSILKNIEIIASKLNVKVSELFDDNLEENKFIYDALSKIDSRTIKKIKKLLSLPKSERHIVYEIIDAFNERHKKKTKKDSNS